MTPESMSDAVEETNGEDPSGPQRREVTPKDLVIDDLTRQIAQKSLELADVRAQLVMAESQMSQAHMVNKEQSDTITELQAIVSTLNEAITEDIHDEDGEAEDVQVEESPIKG